MKKSIICILWTTLLLVNTAFASTQLVVARNKLWKSDRSGTVTLNIAFLTGTPEEKQLIKKYASIWTQYANMDFNFYDSLLDLPRGQKAHIRILIAQRDENASIGGDSYVGTDANYRRNNDSTMRIYISKKEMPSQLRGIVLHEFGHAIGLQHEHQHPEREFSYDQEKILTTCSTQGISESQCKFMHLDTFSTRDHDTYAYDPNSVMHYPLPREGVVNASEAAFTSSSTLSLLDKVGIAKVYPGRRTEESIRSEHALELAKFEDTTTVGACIITPFQINYADSPEPKTFYTYSNPDTGMNLGFGIPSKTDLMENMQLDPRCENVEKLNNEAPVEETDKFEEAFKDFLTQPELPANPESYNTEKCEVLAPGFESSNPYISVYTIHMNLYVLTDAGITKNLAGHGFKTKEDAERAAMNLAVCQ